MLQKQCASVNIQLNQQVTDDKARQCWARKAEFIHKEKKKGLDKDLNAVLYGNKGSQWPVADLCQHVCMLSVGEQARRGKIWGGQMRLLVSLRWM